MSESEEIFTVFRRSWKTLLKWIFRVHGLPEITVDELFEHINSDQPPVLIDIRGDEDYNGVGDSKYGHIPNAMSIPILELESHIEDLESFKEREIVTMCPGGGLSLAAVEILTEAGFKDANSQTLARLSGPNRPGTKATLVRGAAVTIMNNTPTILADFLGSILSRSSSIMHATRLENH